MGISLVKMSESDTGGLVEDEIFGPVMPIIPVEVGCGDGKELISRTWMLRLGISMRDLGRWLCMSARRSGRSS